MYLVSEYAILKQIADEISAASVSCFHAVKNIYFMFDNNKKKFEISDLIKVSVNNLGDKAIFSDFGLIENKELHSDLFKWEYERISELFTLAFAVRIPILKIYFAFDDKQISKIYGIVENTVRYRCADVYLGEYEYFKKTAKKGSMSDNDRIELFDCDWYREYVRRYVPKLYEISNINLLTFGAVSRIMEEIYDRAIKNIGAILDIAEKA